MKEREERGLARPKPARLRAGNCMSVSTGAAHSKLIFLAYLDPRVAVVMLTECADFDGQAVADKAFGPGVWEVVQYGDIGSPESGSLVAVRTERGEVLKHEIVVGSEAGEGIRERSIVTATVRIDGQTPWMWIEDFSAGHAPPRRAPRGRHIFMRKLATVGGVRSGDMNLRARAVARYLQGTRVRGVGVLALCIPRWIPVGPKIRIPKVELVNADHDGVETFAWPRKV